MPEQNNLGVNLCASFIIDPLKDYIEYWCKELGLGVDLTFTPYNQVFQQLLHPESAFNRSTGINVLFIRMEDWLRDQGKTDAVDQIAFLNETYDAFTRALEGARSHTGVPYLIGIVPLSPEHSLSPEATAHIQKMTGTLDAFLKGIPQFYILNLTEIAALYEVEEVFDAEGDKAGHLPFTQEYYAALGTYITRKIRAYKIPPYKVIALDCDNTLWKGICGEDGPLNVVIDEAYAGLQDFLLKKYREGFLLVICSKNNERDVWEVFEQHPRMKLKRDHIIAHRIDWNAKPGNLVSMAKELNVGTDSFIFIDDSAFEIEGMATGCPEVLSIQVPEDAATFTGFLNHIWEFDLFELTEEDAHRNNMYKAEKQRKVEQVNYARFDDFLRDLQISVTLSSLDEKNIERAVQLTLRTNQFNLNGIRKTRQDILEQRQPGETLRWVIAVKDRFGDYGTVGLLIAYRNGRELVLDTFVLSCRVLGRGVEDYVIDELQQYCSGKEVDFITANFRSTSRNQPFIEFLQRTAWAANPETGTYNFTIKNKKQAAAECR